MRSALRNWIIPAVFSSALLWMPLGAVTASQNSSKDLAHAIADRTSRVDEFRFIREKAEKLGVRAWLFGGTAAGYGHYVNWDLKREGGDKRFQADRFDYDYTNIYRSTQDLDIVIDGSPEKATQLEQALRLKYPHLQGSKSAWEVRLLKGTLGDKEALLDNPDYLNQHTDSNSTGMIELTKPAPGEKVVRDLRDWNSKDPNFLKDLRDGKLHYYFSPKHGETSRAAKGLNPPILSVIRYLTKAFQYQLEIRPEDLAQVKKVIAEFDPARDLKDSYVQNWIQKNAKKLIQNAVNIEYAWNTLEELGLRKKLISIGGSPDLQESLAWWLNKEPLRGAPLGQGSGKTAKELGITTVAHETNSFLAYESITRAHTGDPNVLISRAGSPGEMAGFGNGFYTRTGTEGAKGTGLTIRFKLDPKAREGKDFEIHYGDFVLVKNKRALEVIPESLNLTPLEYLQRLSNDETISESDRGILEKFRRRVKAKVGGLSGKEQAELANFVRAHPTRTVIQEWVGWPVSERYPEIAENAVRWAIGSNHLDAFVWLMRDVFPNYKQPALLKEALKRSRTMSGNSIMAVNIPNLFSTPLWKNETALLKEEIAHANDFFLNHLIKLEIEKPEIMEAVILRGAELEYQEERRAVHQSALEVLKEPRWRNHPELLKRIFEAKAIDRELLSHLLSSRPEERRPEWSHWIEAIAERGTADPVLIRELPPETWKQHPEKFQTILKRGDADREIATHLLSRPEWKDPKILEILIERKLADSQIVTQVLTQPFWLDHQAKAKALIQRSAETSRIDYQEFLKTPRSAEFPEIFKEVYRASDMYGRRTAVDLLRAEHWGNRPEILDFLLSFKDEEADEALMHLLKETEFASRDDIVEKLIKRRPASHVVNSFLMLEQWRKNPKWAGWIQKLVDRGTLKSTDFFFILKMPEALAHPEWLKAYVALLLNEDRQKDSAERRVSRILGETEWKNHPELKKWVGKKDLTEKNLVDAILRLSKAPGNKSSTPCREAFKAL